MLLPPVTVKPLPAAPLPLVFTVVLLELTALEPIETAVAETI
jgi:hypothetical protein